MFMTKVLQENVVRGNQAGRIVERPSGEKVFLVGNTRGQTNTPSSGSSNNEQSSADAARSAALEAASSNRQAIQSFMAEQRAREEAALRETEQKSLASIDQFRNVVQGLEKPGDISTRFEQEAGLPELQTQTKALRQRLADAEAFLGQLPGDVQSRTAGTLTTQAQQNRIIAKEQIPVTQNLQAIARNLGIEEQALAETITSIANKVQLEVAAQERLIEPERLNVAAVAQNADRRLATLSSQAARELTGFTESRKAELDVLLQDFANKGQIATEAYRQAAELAREEKSYEEALKQLKEASRLKMEETRQEQGLLAGREQALQGIEGQQRLEQIEVQESGATQRTVLGEEGALERTLIGDKGDTQRTVLNQSGQNYRTLLDLNQSNEPPSKIQEVNALVENGMDFEAAMNRVYPLKSSGSPSGLSALEGF